MHTHSVAPTPGPVSRPRAATVPRGERRQAILLAAEKLFAQHGYRSVTICQIAEEHGLRVVAEGFFVTHEVRLDAREEWLYIVETTGPCISRMRLVESPRGVSLAQREVFGPTDLGGPPDGIAFDAFGNLWCTLVKVDQLITLTLQGDKLLLDDGDPAASQKLLRRMKEGTSSPDDMLRARGSVALWMASITFGGADLKTVYLGSLMGTTIPSFVSPVAGLPMVHW